MKPFHKHLAEEHADALRQAAVGLAAEFTLVVDDRPTRPEDLFDDPRGFIDLPLMHRVGTSYHLPNSAAIYFDTGVIEIATPAMELERGCMARAGRSLWESIALLRGELDRWEGRTGRQARLAGFSAHYNTSLASTERAGMPHARLSRLARGLTYVLPAPVMLLATNRRSTGVGVRPRRHRVEITRFRAEQPATTPEQVGSRELDAPRRSARHRVTRNETATAGRIGSRRDDRALGRAAVGEHARRCEHPRHERDDAPNGCGEQREVGRRDSRIDGRSVTGADEDVGGATRCGTLEHLGDVDGRDPRIRLDFTQPERERAAEQAEPDDGDVHPRTAAAVARTRSASSTASSQASVAGTRATSPARPTQTRSTIPSAPAATAAQATGTE